MGIAVDGEERGVIIVEPEAFPPAVYRVCPRKPVFRIPVRRPGPPRRPCPAQPGRCLAITTARSGSEQDMTGRATAVAPMVLPMKLRNSRLDQLLCIIRTISGRKLWGQSKITPVPAIDHVNYNFYSDPIFHAACKRRALAAAASDAIRSSESSQPRQASVMLRP